MRNYLSFLIIAFLLFASCEQLEKDSIKSNERTISNWKDEIIYHVFQRSFYDSNGDKHGDLKGFVSKLDYLKELGVTTILFTPLYESGFYHNYFPTDYEKIDPEFGSKEDYLAFVEAVHDAGLKFIMDMETQYASSGHIWFDSSYKNPDSDYSDFILYSDSLNEYPEQIFMETGAELKDFTAWPGDTYHIALLDLNNSRVKSWMVDFWSFWVDPNKDGDFSDGVDGFRIDHIMDNLDYKGLITNMYADFWNPIFMECFEINPNLLILGEQSNWEDTGVEMIKKSGANAAFNFKLRFALSGGEGIRDMYEGSGDNLSSINSKLVHEAIQENLNSFPEGTYFVNFLENHDLNRWASSVSGNYTMLRAGAILNLLLPGIPSIYYGQELGLPGEKNEWGSDANHIPVREAFPWTSNPDDAGTAIWYKETGPWWDSSYFQSPDISSMSFEFQKNEKGSLWNHYKDLTSLRKKYELLRTGRYQAIDFEQGFAFLKKSEHDSLLVLVNTGHDTIYSEPYFAYGQPLDGSYSKSEEGKLILAPSGYVIIGNSIDSNE